MAVEPSVLPERSVLPEWCVQNGRTDGQAQAGPGRPRQAQTGPGKPRQAQAGPGRPRQAQTGPGRPRQAQAGPGRPRQASEAKQDSGTGEITKTVLFGEVHQKNIL